MGAEVMCTCTFHYNKQATETVSGGNLYILVVIVILASTSKKSDKIN
jgi:hypothetical protein